jgi:serine protease Do
MVWGSAAGGSGVREEAESLSLEQPPDAISEMLARVGPWVVSIRVKRSKDLASPQSRFVPQVPKKLLPKDVQDYFLRPSGYVTGLLVDRRGLILTSFYNVTGQVQSIEVVLPGGEERRATIAGKDETDDLALLRLEGDEPAASRREWRDPPWSERPLRSGSFVFAVGRSPDPGALTVTQGIVSATGRNGNRAVQTDAKLNYGNVGGPLLDLDGRIVGVGTFVGHTYPQWGMNSGIGFATTTSTIKAALPYLERGLEVELPETPFLGVQADVKKDLDTKGAPILQVVKDSAAARGGLQDGDVIVEFDGEKVYTFNQLRRHIFSHKVSETVVLKVRRGEELLDLKVTLGGRSL